MKLRYTKAERIRKAAAEGLLTDKAASPADKAAALRELRYLETAALRRRDRAEDWYPPAPPVPEPPSVDELVRQLEKGSTVPVPSVSSPLQPVQTIQGSPIGQNVQDGQNDPKLAEVLAIADGKKPTPELIPEPPARPCGLCSRTDTQPTWDGRRLCPPHFSAEAARYASEATAQTRARHAAMRRDVLAQRGEDPNINDLAMLAGDRPSRDDFKASVQIWEQQAREETDRREYDRRERADLEEKMLRQRAEFISRTGMLPPDNF